MEEKHNQPIALVQNKYHSFEENRNILKEFEKWILENECQISKIEFRISETGERGIFAKEDLKPNEVFISIPNRFVISTVHLKKNPEYTEVVQIFEEDKLKNKLKEFEEIKEKRKSVKQAKKDQIELTNKIGGMNINSDSEEEREDEEEIKRKLFSNPHLEDDSNPIIYFLINEKLKGPKAFFYPFLSLVGNIETLWDWGEPYWSELQDEDFDSYLSRHTAEVFDSYKAFLLLYSHILTQNNLLDLFTYELFVWAWKVMATRSFGTSLLHPICLLPVMDMLNHSNNSKIFHSLQPGAFYITMLQRSIDLSMNDPSEHNPANGFSDLNGDIEDDDETQKYDNYINPQKNELDDNLGIEIDKLEDVWDPDREDILVQFKLRRDNDAAIKKGEEITYCYGIRSNIFLLTEYGFVLENNKYSYVNVEINLNKYLTSSEIINSRIKTNLKAINMKENIKVHLKLSSINPDLMIYFRMIYTPELIKHGKPLNRVIEVQIMKQIQNVCQTKMVKFPTTLQEDIIIFENEEINDFRMRFVLNYRMEQKRILEKQIEMCGSIINSLEEEIGKESFPVQLGFVPSMRKYIKELNFYSYYPNWFKLINS